MNKYDLETICLVQLPSSWLPCAWKWGPEREENEPDAKRGPRPKGADNGGRASENSRRRDEARGHGHAGKASDGRRPDQAELNQWTPESMAAERRGVRKETDENRS